MVLTLWACGAPALAGEVLPAKHKQGAVHAFLVVKSLDGKVLAVADEVNVTHGNQMRSRLTYRFRDGSLDDETTVFNQGATLQLVSDHHVQRGPSFPKPLDLAVDVARQQATWHEVKDGKDEVKTEHIDLPNDLANGMLPAVVANMAKGAEVKVSYVTGTPKPRVVTLSIKPDGESSFTVAGASRRALKLDIHIELGGLAGVVAPLVGKQPGDIELWVMDGEAPTVLKMEGALYDGGPTYSVEMASPVWAAAGR